MLCLEEDDEEDVVVEGEFRPFEVVETEEEEEEEEVGVVVAVVVEVEVVEEEKLLSLARLPMLICLPIMIGRLKGWCIVLKNVM